MHVYKTASQGSNRRFVCLLFTLGVLTVPGALGTAQQTKVDLLRIGTSGSLVAEKQADQEKGALDTLQSFIKEETGLENQIVRANDWRDLAEKLAKRQLELGVFQGYEFAWAQEQDHNLKPLALAVNVYRYAVVYVVARKDNPAKDFAGLQGQSLCLPDTAQRSLRLFVDRQSEANGKKPESFFSKITSQSNVEDALDDVVDGVVQATAFDRAALEAYKRRKPARFAKLKEIAHSQPLPPPVIVYYNSVLDEATLRRFKDGLLGAADKEKGKTVLNLFRLTGFDQVPTDFEPVLAATRKAYPPSNTQSK